MEASAEQMQQYIMIGKIIIALVPLATIIQVALNIYNSRRKPSVSEELYRDFATKKDLAERKQSVSEELYRDFATKKELAELRNDFRDNMREMFERQHRNQSAIDDKFQAIMHSIGQVEGEIKKCPHFCKQ